jgi:L-malate glycosyltransferase
MRIMEIVSGIQLNGAMNHCAMLSRELAARGHEVIVLCLPESWISGQFSDGAAEVMLSDLRRFPPGELRRVAREIRSRGIDVLHTHMSRAHFFGVLLHLFAGVPCAATAHSRYFQLHWMFNDLVIAVSEATRRYHCRHNFVRSKRIVTIHNFVSPAALAWEPAGGREQARATLGASSGDLLLGIIGGVFPNKGHLYLVRALAKISAAAGNVKLAIIGEELDPEYAKLLRREAQRLNVAGRIVWAGRRSDMPAVMSALDVCVVASFKETLSLVVLESMAAGVPVVATSVGGIPECVVHGETGLLTPPGDSDSLAGTLIKVLGDPDLRREFGEAGRRRVCEHFSADEQVPAIEAALKSIVRPKTR